MTTMIAEMEQTLVTGLSGNTARKSFRRPCGFIHLEVKDARTFTRSAKFLADRARTPNDFFSSSLLLILKQLNSPQLEVQENIVFGTEAERILIGKKNKKIKHLFSFQFISPTPSNFLPKRQNIRNRTFWRSFYGEENDHVVR